MFTATPEAQLKSTKADTEMTAELTMVEGANYEWGINGPYPNNKPFTIKQGQQATLTFADKSRMWHPMHLHGHTFQVFNPDGKLGARKDTVIAKPGCSQPSTTWSRTMTLAADPPPSSSSRSARSAARF